MNIVLPQPVIGNEYKLVQEDGEMEYRGEKYPYIHHCFEHTATGERITTTRLDEINLFQVYNRYRAAHGIPFADEIRELRKSYGLSASMMSRILGFGENQYRLYESGEVPNLSNGKLLKSVISSPDTFGKLVDDMGESIRPAERKRIFDRISAAKFRSEEARLTTFVFGKRGRSRYNGYAAQSLAKVRNCILYYIEKMGNPYETQMNKLLFYTDFLSYQNYAMGMTGLSYVAIRYGPVPYKWDRLYSVFDQIHTELVKLRDVFGHRLVADGKCDMALFTSEEKELLESVCVRFSGKTARRMSQDSHEEQAWKECVDSHGFIDYVYAFSLTR